MHVADLLEAKGVSVATIAPGPRSGPRSPSWPVTGSAPSWCPRTAPVIDGIVSERDIVRRLSEHRPSLLDEPVSSIMSTKVRTCAPGDTIESIQATMTEERIRHLPVVRDGALCGIVSIGDVVKHRMVELERDRLELMEYITAR